MLGYLTPFQTVNLKSSGGGPGEAGQVGRPSQWWRCSLCYCPRSGIAGSDKPFSCGTLLFYVRVCVCVFLAFRPCCFWF